MLNSFKQKDGRVGVIVWGSITSEARVQKTKNGDNMAFFYIRYGFEPTRNPADKPKAKTIKVLAYKEVAAMCAGLEKWENVLVCGELKESVYNGEKEFHVGADIVLAPNAQIAALSALNEVMNMKGGKTAQKEAETDSDGFSDIDQSDIDDIFPGL